MMACLFSGGKDSTLAIHKAAERGIRTELLITVKPENDYSYMFHKPNVDYTPLQAEAMGIRQVFGFTKGEKELELNDLRDILARNRVTGLITGATASKYQKDRIEAICGELNISCISPLWHIDPLGELNEISERFDSIIVQVSAEGLDESYLGARVDETLIKRLLALNKKYGINLTFEGGEAESFVLDAPLFKKRIVVKAAHKDWGHGVGKYSIDNAVLEAK